MCASSTAPTGAPARCGEGRYRAAPIDREAYLLACSRYIDLNPVRAGLARHPRQYRWSSYRALAEGAADPVVAVHALYLALGRSAAARQEAYRALFRDAIDPAFMDDLRAATNGGWALGGARFKQAIAAALGRRVTKLPPGRPPKPRECAPGKSTLTPISFRKKPRRRRTAFGLRRDLSTIAASPTLP